MLQPAPTHGDSDELLTPREAFSLLRIGKTRGFELIASGQLASVRIGKSRRVPRAALRLFIESLTEQKAG